MGFVLPYVSQLWLNCYHTCAELEDDSERDYSCRCFSNMVEDDFYGDVHVCAADCMGLIGGSVIYDMLFIQ